MIYERSFFFLPKAFSSMVKPPGLFAYPSNPTAVGEVIKPALSLADLPGQIRSRLNDRLGPMTQSRETEPVGT